ncbi:hypothetical protein SAMN06297251_12334 [Fulvimarina manganoxydans]|uniref:Uncharacterized protein n=1 Tax=Fulvimarina manganoxydans TaxID=937218 RepID=A0A1W2EAK6_9HYPH|nr:hypothetical protein SAMN06297251_12334 [Fulvimarina manganoxydans]
MMLGPARRCASSPFRAKCDNSESQFRSKCLFCRMMLPEKSCNFSASCSRAKRDRFGEGIRQALRTAYIECSALAERSFISIAFVMLGLRPYEIHTLSRWRLRPDLGRFGFSPRGRSRRCLLPAAETSRQGQRQDHGRSQSPGIKALRRMCECRRAPSQASSAPMKPLFFQALLDSRHGGRE